MSTSIKLARTRKVSSGFINRNPAKVLLGMLSNRGLYGGEAL
jgi:hypothetical protein